MASPVESAEFQRLLVEGLKKVWDEGKYADIKSPMDRIMKTEGSKRAYEQYYSVTGVGDFAPFTGKVSYSGMFPGFHTKIEPAEFTNGIQFERKLLDDCIYTGVGAITSRAKALYRSAARTIDKLKVSVLPNGFSTAFDYGYSEEGVALFSNSHTTKAGTSTSTGFDNLGTGALNKTNVAAVRLAMRQFRDGISERIEMGDDFTLVVPDELEEQAWEIVKTPKSFDTAEGNQNFHFGRYGIITIPRLSDSDTNDWYMVNETMAKEDLLYVERIKPEPHEEWDRQTHILMIGMYMRNGVGFTDWRWGFGNKVS